MKQFLSLLILSSCLTALPLLAQQAQQSAQTPPALAPDHTAASDDAKAYSGMYSFLKEGEFVQITVEDDLSVSGFISRYEDGGNGKGGFVDQFFKSGKLEGKKLVFATKLSNNVSYDFKGVIERGDGKNPGEDSYFVIKGTLTENTTDLNKKVTSQSQTVAFKSFPQDAH
jgi:hypothetical protein